MDEELTAEDRAMLASLNKAGAAHRRKKLIATAIIVLPGVAMVCLGIFFAMFSRRPIHLIGGAFAGAVLWGAYATKRWMPRDFV